MKKRINTPIYVAFFAVLMILMAGASPKYVHAQEADTTNTIPAYPTINGIDQESLFQWLSLVGNMLYDYHKAYDIAERVVREHLGDRPFPPLHGSGPYDDGWSFSFGEMTSREVFMIDYGVIVGNDGTVRSFDVFEERRKNETHHMLVARALLVAKTRFDMFKENAGYHAPKYRFAVLPFPQGQLTTFISPAQTRRDVAVMGQDIMMTFSRFTTWIEGITPFHKTLFEIPLMSVPENTQALYRVSNMGAPTPADVMNVLEVGYPMVYSAPNGYFYIDLDGKISLMDESDPLVKLFTSQ